MNIIEFSNCYRSSVTVIGVAASTKEVKCHGLPIVPTSTLGLMVLGFMKSIISEKKPSISKKRVHEAADEVDTDLVQNSKY